MRRRVYPESEFVEPEILERLEAGNRVSMCAKYSEDVSLFRAEVIAKILGHGAMNSTSFLYYREQSPTDTDLLVDGENKETLILAGFSNKLEVPPHIKVLTNVMYHHQDYVAFLSEDVTVDRDGDSQMLVDVAMFTHDGDLMPGVHEHEDANATDAVIFQPKGDDNITVINHSDFTPPLNIVHEIEENGHVKKQHVTPFGHYTNLEDKIAALEWASGIVAATDQAELVAWSH